MSDWLEYQRSSKQARKAEKRARRAVSEKQFPDALRIAEECGLTLRGISPVHYQLIGPGEGNWILNIYPGNLRLADDRLRPPAPRLELPDQWTLIDVVHATAQVTQ